MLSAKNDPVVTVSSGTIVGGWPRRPPTDGFRGRAMGVLRAVRAVNADEDEKRAARPGDALVAPADVVMDRAFTVPGPVEQVWPWLVQLGKRRAGWYLPR